MANDSCYLRISLLTCSPGAELYSTFGHSAIRLYDPNEGVDVVFNYGTFDFNDPNFYAKFIRGKLDYFLSLSDYTDFLESYRQEKRNVFEQILHLSCREKQSLKSALQQNLLPQNRSYRYDFIADNCTTRIRDLLLGFIDSSSISKQIVPQNATPRKLIHSYLEQGHKWWSELGIDILLGSKIDRKLSPSDAMFLPEYLMKGLNDMMLEGKRPLVSRKNELLQYRQLPKTSKVNTPFIIFIIFSFIIGFIYFSNRNRTSILAFLSDILLFSMTGVTGILLCFMWWGTDHAACSSNYNLLWALPCNLIAMVFIAKPSRWIRLYFLILSTINGLLLLFWYWLPQQINVALVPVILLLFMRYLQIALVKKA